MMKDYLKELGIAVTISDRDNKIAYMNNKSSETFKKYGGSKLIGSDLLDCHSGEAGRKLKELFNNKASNVYIIEKEDKKKLIFQTPIYQDGEYDGFMAISIPLPEEIPVYKRG